jgi:hypothetical protein
MQAARGVFLDYENTVALRGLFGLGGGLEGLGEIALGLIRLERTIAPRLSSALSFSAPFESSQARTEFFSRPAISV